LESAWAVYRLVGSNPTLSAFSPSTLPFQRCPGGVPEWLNGAVSKTVGRLWRLVGSNPTPSAQVAVRPMASGLVAAALALSGCGGSAARESSTAPPARQAPADTPAPKPAKPELASARCPASAANCRAAIGRVIYLERVDPDGDGDLHVVLLDARSLSAPGVTVLDVSRGLRPDRDPEVGNLVTGSGPVYRGSYGQRQIQVTSFRVAR
jgi:hypothetical protein